MAGYTRVDTSNNIADGNVISASDLDNEFDGVQSAFNATTGHTHGGGVGEGAPITKIGPTEDVTVSASLLAPKITNTVDVGSSLLKFKDLWLAGNASVAALTTSGAVTHNAGTANSVAYLNGSKVLTSGSALTFDGTKLGVGTSSPLVPVDIRASQTTMNLSAGSDPLANLNILNPDTTVNTGPTIAFSSYYSSTSTIPLATISVERAVGAGTSADAGSNNIIFKQAQHDNLALIERFRFDFKGNFGLGVVPKSWSVNYSAMQFGGVGTLFGPKNASAGGTVVLSNNTYIDNLDGNAYIINDEATKYQQQNGIHSWHTAPSGASGDAISFTQALTLNSSGNLGIGTSSPSYKLDIVDTGGLSFKISNDSTQLGVYISGGTPFFGTFTSQDMTFGTQGSPRIRINGTAGNVAIGTFAPHASAILDTQNTTKGVRMPNMTTTQKNAIASPAAGLMVFDTTLAKLCVYTGAAWETITSV